MANTASNEEEKPAILATVSLEIFKFKSWSSTSRKTRGLVVISSLVFNRALKILTS